MENLEPLCIGRLPASARNAHILFDQGTPGASVVLSPATQFNGR